MENTITQAEEIIKYSNEIGFGSMPLLISDTIADIRKVFANAVTTDIDRPYFSQMSDLVKACKENNVEFVNAEVFGDIDDVGILRKEIIVNHPTENYAISIMADVFFSIQLHDNNGEDTEENTFLVSPYYADVTISNTNAQEDITIQDVNSNELAIAVKGDNVRLQINSIVIEENGRTFVYDGCHKLYVICDEYDREQAKECDYIVDGSIAEDEIEHPISELEEFYLKSCPLRFIHYFNLQTPDILPQFSDCPMFIYF